MKISCILSSAPAVFLCTSAFSVSAFVKDSIGHRRVITRLHPRTPALFMSERDEMIDEDDEVQQAYGRRSLGWTNKYRSVIPYEKARRSVMGLGLRSKEDWDEYVADGKVYHGPYLPNHPDQMYELEWVSWEEFLGITRPHDETRHIVQNVLKLKDMDEYETFVAADTKRAEGLRIPAKPEIVYKDKGWISFEHFFGQ